MAQPYLDQLCELVSSVHADRCDLACKHFFSGAALYCGDHICASLTPKGLAFKFSEHRCEELITRGGAVPLRYFDKSPIKRNYVLFPDFRDLDEADISSYFEECMSYVTGGG
jgi:hypothetical protein